MRSATASSRCSRVRFVLPVLRKRKEALPSFRRGKPFTPFQRKGVGAQRRGDVTRAQSHPTQSPFLWKAEELRRSK